MNNELFGQPYDTSDPYWIVKGYFDVMYNNGRFIDAIEHISRKVGFSTDGAYCHFPDMNSYYEENHFTGIMFIYGYLDSDEVIVGDETGYYFIKQACELYLKHHQADKVKIGEILSNVLKWDSLNHLRQSQI